MGHKAKYDVIVIGAGIAGLKATQYLADQDLRVLLVEARNRVGGRIHTIQTTDGYPIEAGSLMLQNPGTSDKPNPLAPLLLKLNLKLLPVDTNQADIFDTHGHRSTLLKLTDHYEAANRKIQKAKETLWQQPPSLADILMYYPDNIPKRGTLDFLARQTITAMLAQQTGVTPHQLSLYELALKNEIETDYKLVLGGYQHLPESMAKMAAAKKTVTIQLNTPVKEIHHDPKAHHAHIVTSDQQEYSANSILCTVPLGVLKHKKIQFSPEISKEKQRLIKSLEIGNHNKIILEFEKPFWRKEAQFLYPGSEHIQEWPEYINLYYFSNQKTTTLICNVYAEEAQFNHMTGDQILKKALLPLQKIYDKKISRLKAAYITHWDLDPYTLGSTSCCGVHLDPAQLNHFTTPEPGGLYFAGAHTLSNGYRETIEGAYRSGLRAAIDIHLRLKSTT